MSSAHFRCHITGLPAAVIFNTAKSLIDGRSVLAGNTLG